MKRILAVLAVLALTAPTVALARDGDNNRGRGGQTAQQGGGEQNNGGQPRGRRGGPPPGQTAGPQNNNPGGNANNANNSRGNPPPGALRNVNPSFNAQNGGNQNNQNRNRGNLTTQQNSRIGQNERDRNDNDRRRFDNNRGRDNDRGRFDNNRGRFDNDRNRGGFEAGRFVNRDRGYRREPNIGRRFNFRGRAFVSVRAPRFFYPRGYGYRRWYVGAFLPSLFLTDTYYVDWDYIGLPPPGPGEEWVRYGPDALLVDIYSGRVIDVAYGVFY